MNSLTTKSNISESYLGSTGYKVTRLGAGLAEIATLNNDSIASKIFNLALDEGINFLDTAPCYGNSEALVGKCISHRRDEYFLATKAGHLLHGEFGTAWTSKTILNSIDRSLKRMKTDYIDLVQLHSCNTNTLINGDAIEALQKAKQVGKTRFIGYSGNPTAAEWAIQSDLFDIIQITFNLLDQFPLESLLQKAREKNIGVITKHSIANAVWQAKNIYDKSLEVYKNRAETMLKKISINKLPKNPITTALGFVLAHSEINVALVGTKNLQHMRENIKIFKNELPISPEVVYELRSIFNDFIPRE